MSLLLSMPTILRNAGLTVIEMPFWKNKANERGIFTPKGLLLHHDGMGLGFNTNPSDDLNVPKNMSKPDALGSQLWVGNKGQWVIIASGRMAHAGKGSGGLAFGIPTDQGNKYLLGIETDHTIGSPWPEVQVNSIMLGSHALAVGLGYKAENCLGHKEYAPGRKADPENFDLNAWRKTIKEGVDDMPTADEVAAALLGKKLDVKDAYYGWLGRNPKRNMSIQEMIVDIFQDSKIQTRDGLIGRGIKPEDVK